MDQENKALNEQNEEVLTDKVEEVVAEVVQPEEQAKATAPEVVEAKPVVSKKGIALPILAMIIGGILLVVMASSITLYNLQYAGQVITNVAQWEAVVAGTKSIILICGGIDVIPFAFSITGLCISKSEMRKGKIAKVVKILSIIALVISIAVVVQVLVGYTTVGRVIYQ